MNNQAIKKLRLQLGISQEDFAHLIGVKLMSVSRWELGKGNPGLQAKREIKKLMLKRQNESQIR